MYKIWCLVRRRNEITVAYYANLAKRIININSLSLSLHIRKTIGCIDLWP